jgi:hypothetical protein
VTARPIDLGGRLAADEASNAKCVAPSLNIGAAKASMFTAQSVYSAPTVRISGGTNPHRAPEPMNTPVPSPAPESMKNVSVSVRGAYVGLTQIVGLPNADPDFR